jgi:hypothetical protein
MREEVRSDTKLYSENLKAKYHMEDRAINCRPVLGSGVFTGFFSVYGIWPFKFREGQGIS